MCRQFITQIEYYIYYIQLLLSFQDIVSSYEVGGDGARFSVIKYSTTVRTEFNLDKYDTKADIVAAIDRIAYQVK